jgi:hypothetical protein
LFLCKYRKSIIGKWHYGISMGGMKVGGMARDRQVVINNIVYKKARIK